jgi:ribonuclease J
MNIIIHRGTHEIGGSCVEVQHENTRLVIDIGMPLVTSKGERFDMRSYDGLSDSELIEQGILPNITGFYRCDTGNTSIDGLLVSHAHFDHYGFARYLRDDIKYHLGEGTRQLMKMSSVFSGHDCKVRNYCTFESGKPFKVGCITVTPYLADHSAFDAYSLLLEVGGKQILYTGDFREHGRKSVVFSRMIKDIPKGVDALLLEGTMIGRDGFVKSEMDVEEEFCSLFKSESNTVLIAVSGQNIDRLVSIYRAAKKSGRTLVIDPYVAHVLTGLSKLARLPYPSPKFPDVRVYFPQRFCRWLSRNGNENLFKPFGQFKITYAELNKKPEQIVMLVRPSTLDFLKKMDGIDGATLVWSQWEGYLKDDTRQINTLHDFIELRRINLRHIHTSGHAPIDTMKKLTSAIQPKLIIPIHTSYPERYKEIFPDIPVAVVQDGVPFSI